MIFKILFLMLLADFSFGQADKIIRNKALDQDVDIYINDNGTDAKVLGVSGSNRRVDIFGIDALTSSLMINNSAIGGTEGLFLGASSNTGAIGFMAQSDGTGAFNNPAGFKMTHTEGFVVHTIGDRFIIMGKNGSEGNAFAASDVFFDHDVSGETTQLKGKLGLGDITTPTHAIHAGETSTSDDATVHVLGRLTYDNDGGSTFTGVGAALSFQIGDANVGPSDAGFIYGIADEEGFDNGVNLCFQAGNFTPSLAQSHMCIVGSSGGAGKVQIDVPEDGDCNSNVPGGNICSGTYTNTVDSETCGASVSATGGNYYRVGDMVTVWGGFNMGGGSCDAGQQIVFDLPVATATIPGNDDIAGSATCTSTTNAFIGAIQRSGTRGVLQIKNDTCVINQVVNFHFSYEIQ